MAGFWPSGENAHSLYTAADCAANLEPPNMRHAPALLRLLPQLRLARSGFLLLASLSSSNAQANVTATVSPSAASLTASLSLGTTPSASPSNLICAAGTYRSAIGAPCFACPDGNYCLGGGALPSACSAGTFSASGSGITSACSPCACDAGYYSNITSSAGCVGTDGTCTLCRAGMGCSGGSTLPVACGGGSWSRSGATSPNCTSCVISGQCGLCAAGSYCNVAANTAHYDSNRYSCGCNAPCGVATCDQTCMKYGGMCFDFMGSLGGFCSPGTFSAYEGASTCSMCTCSPGFVSTASGQGSAGCAGNSGSCNLCPAGFSCASGGGAMATPCTCSVGYASTTPGAIYCVGSSGTCAPCPSTSACAGGSSQPASASPTFGTMPSSNVTRTVSVSPTRVANITNMTNMTDTNATWSASLTHSSLPLATPSPASSSSPVLLFNGTPPSATLGQVVIARYADNNCIFLTGYIAISSSCAPLDNSSNAAFAALRGNVGNTSTATQNYASSDLASPSPILGTRVWSSLAACQNTEPSWPLAIFGSTAGITMTCDRASNLCYNNMCAGAYKCVSGCLSYSQAHCGMAPVNLFNPGTCALSGSSTSTGIVSYYSIDESSCTWINCAASISGGDYAGLSCSCPTASCNAASFRPLPRMDLVGTLVGNAFNPSAGFVVGGTGVSSEYLCRLACCGAGAGACTAYVYAPYTTGLPSCFLYTNVTGLVPSTLLSSAVLISKYS